AVAVSADLELRRANLKDPFHLKAEELLQLSPTLYESTRAVVYSSKLPSDPGLKVYLTQATLEETRQPRQAIFGTPQLNPETGDVALVPQRQFRGTDVFLEVEDVPVFYLPFLQGDPEHPLGPVNDVNVGYNNIFGLQLGVGLDVYNLLGLTPIAG